MKEKIKELFSLYNNDNKSERENITMRIWSAIIADHDFDKIYEAAIEEYPEVVKNGEDFLELIESLFLVEQEDFLKKYFFVFYMKIFENRYAWKNMTFKKLYDDLGLGFMSKADKRKHVIAKYAKETYEKFKYRLLYIPQDYRDYMAEAVKKGEIIDRSRMKGTGLRSVEIVDQYLAVYHSEEELERYFEIVIIKELNKLSQEEKDNLILKAYLEEKIFGLTGNMHIWLYNDRLFSECCRRLV